MSLITIKFCYFENSVFILCIQILERNNKEKGFGINMDLCRRERVRTNLRDGKGRKSGRGDTWVAGNSDMSTKAGERL